MATSKVTLSWGKPKIEVKKLGSSPGEWQSFATPVEGTTQLSTTQGNKMEAKIEGGENEAVKYKKNTYQLVFNVRQAPERTDPIVDADGIVEDEYSIRVTPENAKALGILIDRASVNVQKTYDVEGGLIKVYTCDVLVAETGDAVKIQVISPEE
ncbi:MAG: hypothetical protein IAA73_07300 [Bacteroidetes bacterium]|uniref:Uncharacterized protein n=1 Tax=Candidatus Gallipaludibacter merdavium TaxID=2840839 RepID=A0A9D9HUV2_9BACT|nr:hypothetical protein [Candidatus Gallipaludibacter merdavium]